MPDLITRCPKCATAFRISDNLLQSAKGMVRCGSCLQVFNARENLEPQPKAPPPPPLAQQPQAPSSREAPQPPISISGFLKRQDIDDQSETSAPEASITDSTAAEDASSTHAEGASLFERHEALQVDQDEPEEEEDDEAWALELLKDDSDLNVQFKKIVENPRPSKTSNEEQSNETPALAADESQQHLAGGLDSPTTPDVDAEILPQQRSVEAQAPNMDELLAEIETTTDDASQPKTGRESITSNPGIANEKHGPALPPITKQDDNRGEQHASATATWTPRPIRENIAAIEPEPLEVDWDPTPGWKKRLLWPLLAIVALVVLLGQVAWLEFHRLNTVEPYRSFYAIACQYLDCTLPALVDRSKIDTAQLVVRSHPQIENALKVDVILENNADFEQSFPTLLLTFSDLRNEAVASRRLTPDEYLGGELAGQTMMPVRQPIHIGLEIVDPGEQAVSYSIAIID